MIKTYTITSFGNYIETEVSTTLRASGGDLGGGSELLIIDNNTHSELILTFQTGGIYRLCDVSPTVDTNGLSKPFCNLGGVVVVKRDNVVLSPEQLDKDSKYKSDS